MSTEPQIPSDQFFAGKRVFLTGHSGFKGGWLALWLHRLGASVYGFALDPPTEPSLFKSAGISTKLASDTRADLSDFTSLKTALVNAEPEIVFHLAAQPLVLASYREPLGTFATNIMGTANVLEAVRAVRSVRAIVVVTTDKVYENWESTHPYKENHPLGGHDPYSASKAAAELVTASYRASFFSEADSASPRVATARAGNVIGGGDWASNRLVPDCVRAFLKGESVFLRLPNSVRPWQHVLDPLSGYLQLAQRLCGSDGRHYARAWNFGPESAVATVGQIAEMTARLWGGEARVEQASTPPQDHETRTLRLDSSLAVSELQWKPRWPFHHALDQTVAWYRAWSNGADMAAVTLSQILDYEAATLL